MYSKKYLWLIALLIFCLYNQTYAQGMTKKMSSNTNDSLHQLINNTNDIEKKREHTIELLSHNMFNKAEYVIHYIRKRILPDKALIADTLFLAKVYNFYGMSYSAQEAYNQADSVIKIGILLANKIDSEEGRVVLLDLKSNEATMYGERGFKNIQLQKLMEIHPLLLRIKNTTLLFNIYTNLGLVYYKYNELERALVSLEKGRKQLSSAEIIPRNRGANELLAASIFHKLDNLDSLKKYIDIADKIVTPELMTGYKSRHRSLKAFLAANQKDFKRAYQLIEEAVDLSLQTKDYEEQLFPKLIRAKCLIMQDQYPKAINQLLELLNFKDRKTEDYYKETILQTLAEVYRKNGDSERAMDTYIQLVDFQNKEFEQHKLSHIEEIDYNFKYNERVLEIEKLKANNDSSEIAKQRNIVFFISLILILVIVLGILSVIIIGHKRKKNLDEQKYLLLESKIMEERKTRIIDEMRLSRRIEERERNRIATDLHDSVGGLLSSMRIAYFEIKDRQEFNEESLKQGERILSYIDETKQELNRIVYNLTPLAVENFGLLEAIKQYAKKIQTPTLRVHLQLLSISPKISSADEITLYRIIQELLSNVLKHADASEILLQIQSAPQGTLILTIEDNGRGMDTAQSYSGLGMHTLRSRVQQLGGTLQIESEKDKGTGVYIVCHPYSLHEN